MDCLCSSWGRSNEGDVDSIIGVGGPCGHSNQLCARDHANAHFIGVDPAASKLRHLSSCQPGQKEKEKGKRGAALTVSMFFSHIIRYVLLVYMRWYVEGF